MRLIALAVRSTLAPGALERTVGRLEARDKVGQMLDFVNGDAVRCPRRRRRPGAPLRYKCTAETELGGLAQAQLALADRPNLAARPISPKTVISGGTGWSASDETTAAATARSAAGSLIRRPPATFR